MKRSAFLALFAVMIAKSFPTFADATPSLVELAEQKALGQCTLKDPGAPPLLLVVYPNPPYLPNGDGCTNNPEFMKSFPKCEAVLMHVVCNNRCGKDITARYCKAGSERSTGLSAAQYDSNKKKLEAETQGIKPSTADASFSGSAH